MEPEEFMIEASKHFDAVVWFLRRRLFWCDAESIAQDAILLAATKSHLFDPSLSSLKTFVRMHAKDCLSRWVRSESRRRIRENKHQRMQDMPVPVARLVEIRETASRAAMVLTEREREVFERSFTETSATIAKAMRLSQANVWQIT